MQMNNKTYDILKWVALCFLPAFCVLYATIGEVWDLPYVTQVVSTIAAVDTFLGAIIGISSAKYKKSHDNANIDNS